MTKILLVEDDEEIVKNLTHFLQEEGFSVQSVSGQSEAIRMIEERAQEINLILHDSQRILIQDCQEGELAILSTQLGKLVGRLSALHFPLPCLRR